LYSLQQKVKVISFIQRIPKQLLVGNMECHSLDQEERHLQLLAVILETFNLFKMTNYR